MRAHTHNRGNRGAKLRCRSAVALTCLLMAGLAALPTASANPGSASPDTTPGSLGPSLNLPVGQLNSLTGSLPLSELTSGSVGLEQLLTSLPALQSLTPLQSGLLSTLVSTLPGTTPVSGLLEGVLTTLGVHVTPAELLGALAGTATDPATVAQVISDLAGSLTVPQLGQLQSIFAQLLGALSSGELSQVQEALADLLGPVGVGQLKEVLTPLEGLLSGGSLTQLQALIGSLGSLSVPQIEAKLQELLGGLDSNALSAFLGQLFSKFEPSQVNGVVGEVLGGLPFTSSTVGQLAGNLGMSLEGLSSATGIEPQDLPADLSAVTAPVGNEGQRLSLLHGLGGLNLSLLNGQAPGQPGEGGAGGSGSGSGGAGSNGSGGSGSNGTPGGGGSTTVQVTVPNPSTTAAQTSTRSTKKLAKVKIISHRVKGKVVTLVVQVPAAGKLTVSGRDTRSSSRQVSKAKRLTIRLSLSRAGTAALHKRHSRLQVKLEAAFKAVGGGASSATAKVTFA